MEDYVTFEQALRLKKLGFNWKCNQGWVLNVEKKWVFQPNYYYQSLDEENNIIPNPTLSQAQKWLREVKEICVNSLIKIHKGQYKYAWDITLFKEDRSIWDENEFFDSYEQALSAGIDRALELLK